jgi:hypothetical protein
MKLTYKNGLAVTLSKSGFFELHSAGQLVGRIQFRKNFFGKWAADCYGFDGDGFRLDRVLHSQSDLREARRLASEWAEGVDRHCHACSLPN